MDGVSRRPLEGLGTAITTEPLSPNATPPTSPSRQHSEPFRSGLDKDNEDVVDTLEIHGSSPEQAQPYSPITMNPHPSAKPPPDRSKTWDGSSVSSEEAKSYSCQVCSTLSGRIAALESELAQQQSESREEQNSYVEKLDALGSKLRYLTREIAESARKAAVAAPAGSIEQQLAERNEKISLLMAEGQSLAITEQKHRSLIKRMTAQRAESDLKLAKLKTEHENLMLKMELKFDGVQLALETSRRNISDLNNEIIYLRGESSTKDGKIASLKAELENSGHLLGNTTSEADDGLLAEARLRIAELELALATRISDQKAALDGVHAELEENRRRAEMNQKLYLQTKTELETSENKLEGLRIIIEETTNISGGPQSNLLRQIETLQSQHAIARENWQGIEASLLSKIASQDRERGEMLSREAELRKKAKDLVT